MEKKKFQKVGINKVTCYVKKMSRKKKEKQKKIQKNCLPKEDLAKSMEWAHTPTATPEFVRNVILALQEAQNKGDESEAAGKRALDALARAMGLVPSSEQTPKKKIPISKPLEQSELERLELKEKEIKLLMRYVARQHKKIQARIKEALKSQNLVKIDTKNQTEFGPLEPILGGTAAGTQEDFAEHFNPKEGMKENMGSGTLETTITRFKNDLVLGRRDKTLTFQKLYNPQTGVTVYPDTSLIGPKGFQVTWRALANVTVLAFGMALPLSRIEKLFGSKGFSRSNTSSYCAYVAGRLMDVYIAMSKELANCDILMGDDCVSRVSDLTRYRRELKVWKKVQKSQNHNVDEDLKNTEPQKPWENLKDNSLTKQLEKELDFEFAFLKIDQSEHKTQLNTTVLSGETIVGNPRSRVILYRSHLGSVGNLLSRILLSRARSKKELVFVGDLSASNRVRDEKILKHIKISYAGCTSHARRPFKRHLDHDPENCLDALDHFRALYHLEDIIAQGDPSLKAQLRTDSINGSMSFWNDLKTICQDMLDKWSPATALGEGIRYVISNFEQLTMYCRDFRLPISNDLSERLLRFEKLMDRSSFGRETIEGRARYDIIRSFYQSSLFAGVDPAFAFLDVLITPAELVSASPEKYTPIAIAARLHKDPERLALINTILTTASFEPLVKFVQTKGTMHLDENEI